MRKTFYSVYSDRIEKRVRIALASDLHGRSPEKAIRLLSEVNPDIIAVAGDLTERLDCSEGNIAPNDTGKPISHKNALRFLRCASSIAPTFYSLGNHEICGHKYRLNYGRLCLPENLEAVRESGATLLDDRFVTLDGIVIGGLTTGMTNKDLRPVTAWLDGFEKSDGFHVLICHHPEYYKEYIEKNMIELMLSGHAHGGQIRLFGRGLFAPGQGVLPKYTSGVHDGRLVVSRGLCNTARPIPRLFNPTELVVIDIIPKVQ